jgi:hypothetical protein
MSAGRLDPRLRAAVDASLGWYDALCALHGVRCGLTDGTWFALDPPPPLHSSVKTVEPGVSAEQALAAVRVRGSVADSFGTLDLAAAGFALLFEAQWIHRRAQQGPVPPHWSVVRDEDALARWTARHDTAAVLLPGLLDRSSFTVLVRTVDGPVAGAVVRLGGVSEVSNVWASPVHELDWEELVRVVSELHPGRDLVGYERGADLDRARAAGFTPVGPQRVWAR